MVFYTEDEEFDDESPALKTAQAQRESARNVIMSIHEDIMNPKVYIQDTDPETGFPLGKQLVSGGIEYFNDHETNVPDASEYNIDAILAGDIPIEEAMAKMNSPEKARPIPSPVPHATIPAPVAAAIPPNLSFDKIGLPFLRDVPTLPDQLVQIRFSGQASFQIPFACHAVVCSGQLILLVTDKRSVPTFTELDFQVDRSQFRTELVLPDQTVVPVVAPVPKTISFELGILRCTMFLRRPA